MSGNKIALKSKEQSTTPTTKVISNSLARNGEPSGIHAGNDKMAAKAMVPRIPPKAMAVIILRLGIFHFLFLWWAINASKGKVR